MLARLDQFVLGDRLDIGINRQDHVLTMSGRDVSGRLDVDAAPAGVLAHSFEARSSGQFALKLQLDSLQPISISATAPQQMRAQGSHGIKTHEHGFERHARDLQFHDFLGDFLALVLDHLGVAAVVSLTDGGSQFVNLHIQQFCQFCQILIHLVEVSRGFLILLMHEMRVYVDGHCLHGSRHEHPVAVGDVAASSLQRAGLVLLAFGPYHRLGRSISLQIGHAQGHGKKRQRNQPHDDGGSNQGELGHRTSFPFHKPVL